MADAGLAPYPKFKSILADGSGLPNAGGFVYFYVAGTSTPKDTQVSRTGANNANPVELDANGEADVWYLSGNYKVVETTSALVTIRTTDDVSAAGDLPALWTQTGDDIYYDAGQVYIGATSGGEDLTVVGTASVSSTLDVGGLITADSGLVIGSGDPLTLTGFSDGSVLFVDSSGNIAEDNSSFFWDDSNNRLKVSESYITASANPTIRLDLTDDSLVSSQILGTIEWYQIDPDSDGIGVVASVTSVNESSFSGAGSLVFSTGTAVSYAERARIDSNGILNSLYGVTLASNADFLLSTTSDMDVGSGNFTVAGATGNTLIVGTLGVTGITSAGTLNATGNVDAATLSTGNETFTYDEGTFTATYTGYTTTVNPTMSYARIGNMVTIYTNAATGTSNTTGLTCSGMPASIRPPAQGAQCFIAAVTDNGTTTANCKVAIDSSGVMTFYLLSGSNWTTNFTNSGTKGHQATAISYNLVSVI